MGYRKGSAWEWKVKRDLESKGWYVVQSATMDYPDLMCVAKDGSKVGIKCVSSKSDATVEERKKLLDLWRGWGIFPAFAYPIYGLRSQKKKNVFIEHLDVDLDEWSY
jgi:Holliday junction resolvase